MILKLHYNFNIKINNLVNKSNNNKIYLKILINNYVLLIYKKLVKLNYMKINKNNSSNNSKKNKNNKIYNIQKLKYHNKMNK